MTGSHFSFRAAACCLVVSVLSAARPATAADALPGALELAVVQPGTPDSQDAAPQSVAQQPAGRAPATVAPAKHHLSRWVWVVVIAGVAVGAGTAIVSTNRQPGRISTPVAGVTVNVGGASPGAP